jgi:hypothetical protein
MTQQQGNRAALIKPADMKKDQVTETRRVHAVLPVRLYRAANSKGEWRSLASAITHSPPYRPERASRLSSAVNYTPVHRRWPVHRITHNHGAN